MKIFYKFFYLSIILVLSSCSTSLQNIIDSLNYSKTGADVVSYSYTDKTTTDHAISYFFNKDCSLARTLKLKEICYEINRENEKFIVERQRPKEKAYIVSKKKVSKNKRLIVPSMAY